MHLLPTGGLSRWRCSSIQACRFSGMGSMDYSLKAAMHLSSIAIGVGSASMPSVVRQGALAGRSEEHTSELQSLMRISYAVFCLKKKSVKAISPHEHTRR